MFEIKLFGWIFIYFCVYCRCKDFALRKEYVQLVDSVKEFGGDVKIFSSMHTSGERKYDGFCCSF